MNVEFPDHFPLIEIKKMAAKLGFEVHAVNNNNALKLVETKPMGEKILQLRRKTLLDSELSPNNVVALRRPARIMPFNNHPGPGAA